MKTLKRIIECREGRRCNSPLSCKHCGESWQKAKFKAFANCLPDVISGSDIITYLVIKPSAFLTLGDGIAKMFEYIDDLREAKKRGRMPVMYSRLEVSFGKKSLGFNPHLNILSFGDTALFEELAESHGLSVWKRSKPADTETALSIVWYMLKFNNIGIEKGEAVRIALNRRTQLLHSKEFNHKTINYIDEFIDIDFSFMGVYPIRTKEEIELRKKLKEERKQLNAKYREMLKRVQLAQ